MNIVDQHMQAWLAQAQPHSGNTCCSLDQWKRTLKVLMYFSMKSKWPF